jgi:hypothetical protein
LVLSREYRDAWDLGLINRPFRKPTTLGGQSRSRSKPG